MEITGRGTIDTDPFAMVVVSQVPNLGTITIRDDGTNLWEYGGADYGNLPSGGGGAGAPLSGFATLVEGTLGQREGAGSMLSLASPTGYLSLDRSQVTAASFVGKGSVGGVPVRDYRVRVDVTRSRIAGTTPEEQATIEAAIQVLEREGYTGTTVVLSIDDQGLVRRAVSTSEFADGGSTTADSTFSNFRCAGRVLMPGEQATPQTPGGCTTASTTTVPAATTPHSTASSTTAPTVPSTTTAAPTTTLPSTAAPPTPTTTTAPSTTTTPTSSTSTGP